MLGRWNLEVTMTKLVDVCRSELLSVKVASLSWIEKKLATALFSEVPDASYEDSLASFRRAYELRPDWKENMLFMAKVLIAQKKVRDEIPLRDDCHFCSFAVFRGN